MISSVKAVDIKGVGKSLMAEYKKSATTQTKIVDLFLAFILVTGILQFLYCVIVGSFPFNSFLSGFLSCVGMFALTVSLRLQVSSEKVVEKAFGEYAFCCLLLFFVVFNFIG
eukprot:evm.model.NODE_1500_length_3886_cov_21.659033.3